MQGLNGFHSPYHMMQGGQGMYPQMQPQPPQMQPQMPQFQPQQVAPRNSMPFGMGGHFDVLRSRMSDKDAQSFGGLMGMAK
jgi:hypothetical protein